MNFNNAVFVASYGTANQLPLSNNLEFVFCGRSNVGKSSLINKLVSRKSLAKTSSSPGKTATINFFKIDDIFFVDLPGYGYAKVAKTEKQRWSKLIDAYFASHREFALIIQLIDIRHKPSDLDIVMINFLIESELPFVIALTKADKLSKTAILKRKEELMSEIPYGEQIEMIPFSSVSGLGVSSLQKIIEEIHNA